MLPRISITCALLMATLAYGNHLRFAQHGSGDSVASASVSGIGFNPLLDFGHGIKDTTTPDDTSNITPDEESEADPNATPEETELRRFEDSTPTDTMECMADPTTGTNLCVSQSSVYLGSEELNGGEKVSDIQLTDEPNIDRPDTKDTANPDNTSDIAADGESIVNSIVTPETAGAITETLTKLLSPRKRL
ncbi:hypothetical protein K7432_009108 [Basidiobolus ranarum]|uniref:Uncharacterized protein n=1 Tax=Basidiobolus ranarum TaxID=34480 RepID=A0ABR2WQX8_9FUNG